MHAIRNGCVVTFKKPIFGPYCPRRRTAEFKGEVLIKGEVVRHSYGSLKGQHTFTIKIIDISGNENNLFNKNIEDKMLIKGRNLYPNIVDHIQGEASKRESY